MQKLNSGFSLVEIMVGLVIGLIGVLVIFQVFTVFEAQKRTTSSGSEAQQSGMMALYGLDRDVRLAGYGISNAAALGCTTNAWISGAQQTLPPLAPVSIATNANGTNSLSIIYGNSSSGGAPVSFAFPAADSSANLQIKNQNGFVINDFIIAYESGLACSLLQITGITPAAAPGLPTDLLHASGGSPHNPPAGSNIFPAGGYSNNAQLFNLGSLNVITYGIDTVNNRLTQTDVLTNTVAELADNIVNLRVQYGWDVNNNGTVEQGEYIDAAAFPAPAAAAQWAQVLSIRVALLARSNLRERINAQAAYTCNTTTAVPGPAWAAFVMRNDADGTLWNCYRYSSYETVIPLRNIIWMR